MATVIRGIDNFDTAVKQGLGEGQTLQDMTASRTLATTYTNSGGRSIQATVSFDTGVTGSTYINATVGGILVSKTGIQARTGAIYVQSLSVIIPSGSTYKFDAPSSPALNMIWTELR